MNFTNCQRVYSIGLGIRFSMVGVAAKKMKVLKKLGHCELL